MEPVRTSPDAPKAIYWDKASIDSGTIESLKWLAVLLMTIDHINSYFIFPLTGKPYVELFNMGRVAFPLFALVIAYNLARPRSNNDEKRAIVSALKRLTIFGVISMLPYYFATSGRTLPLNIMFTLALATALIYNLRIAADKESRFARYTLYFFTNMLFVIGASLVEFSFYGVSLIIAAWLFFRYSSSISLVMTVILTFSLYAVNESHWALLALPIFALGYVMEVKIPRINKYAFYAYYPLHLTVIAVAVALHKAYL